MPSTRRKLAAAGLIAWALGGLAAAPPLADAKNAVIRGWGRVVDPDRDCEVALKDGALGIKIPGKPHDFAAEVPSDNAPRVMREVQGDFIAEVLVGGSMDPGETSLQPRSWPYHGAGLMVVKDPNNYVTAHLACAFVNGKIRHYANFELRRGGQLAVSHAALDVPSDQDLRLRLERRGKTLYHAMSPDGIHWDSYEPIELDLPPAAQLGVAAVNTSNRPLAVRFRDLKVFQRARLD